jgi:hypothetical protein
MGAGEQLLRIAIDKVGLEITIDPAGSPFSSGGFAYDVPKIKDRNPLYNALRAKAAQLRDGQGVTGVIIGDGDCAAPIADRPTNWDEVSAVAIAKDSLRQNSSIDFVLILTIRVAPQLWRRAEPLERRVHPMLVVGAGCQAKNRINSPFTALHEPPRRWPARFGLPPILRKQRSSNRPSHGTP